VIGLQLAIRSDRVSALVCGGFPVLGGPYREMLQLSEAMAATPIDGVDPRVSGGFANFYHHLQNWDERTAVAGITCPRLAYVGTEDRVSANGVDSPIVDLIRSNEPAAAKLGWEIHYVEGYDHPRLGTDAAAAAAVVRPFLDENLL
jgi:hypothetical protein